MEYIENNTGLRSFFTKIYSKMTIGVLITSLVSFALSYTNIGQQLFAHIFSSRILYYGIIAVQIILMFGIQLGMKKLSRKQAEILFYLYAAINGLTLSVILYVYTGTTIISAFVGALGVFVALTFLGRTMKYDMSGWGTFLFAGMWGVFITSIINIFFGSNMVDWIVTVAGVLVFSGLTVYDTQVYKKMYLASNEGQGLEKMIELAALHMYMNFIMIFVNLLKIIGGRD